MAQYRTAMLPFKAPIDKPAALALFERHTGCRLAIDFYNRQDVTASLLDEWERTGVVPFDIGAEKYNRIQNASDSATEFCARLYRFELTSAEQELITMLNTNNDKHGKYGGKGGFLKGLPGRAIAWVIRELYELDGYDHTEIARRGADTVRFWLDASRDTIAPSRDSGIENGVLAQTVREAKQGSEWEKRPASEFPALTVVRLASDMWRLGVAEEEIHTTIMWWLIGWRQVRQAVRRGEELYRQMVQEGKIRRFAVGDLLGVYIETPDKFVSKAGSKSCDVFVTVHPETGHAAVLTRKLDCVALAEELKRREPGLWYYSHGQVLNGGVMYKDGTPATGFRGRELAQLIQKFPPQRPMQS